MDSWHNTLHSSYEQSDLHFIELLMSGIWRASTSVASNPSSCSPSHFYTSHSLSLASMASSSKGKMPAAPTAKHTDAEGYEMPW